MFELIYGTYGSIPGLQGTGPGGLRLGLNLFNLCTFVRLYTTPTAAVRDE